MKTVKIIGKIIKYIILVPFMLFSLLGVILGLVAVFFKLGFDSTCEAIKFKMLQEKLAEQFAKNQSEDQSQDHFVKQK